MGLAEILAVLMVVAVVVLLMAGYPPGSGTLPAR
jgi:hypothetical protein